MGPELPPLRREPSVRTPGLGSSPRRWLPGPAKYVSDEPGAPAGVMRLAALPCEAGSRSRATWFWGIR
jgi:hypothetical protein